MSDGLIEVPDLEAPPADAFEQSVPAGIVAAGDPGIDALPDDPEVPEPDAIEQLQPAPAYDEEEWR